MIAWFVRNPVAANLLMVAILVWGGFVLFTRAIPIEMFPRAGLELIVVNVSYRGGSPEEIERAITKPIEAAIFDLQGIDSIQSTSFEGRARVQVFVKRSRNEQDLLAEVKTRVDAIADFPAEAELPRIQLNDKDDNVLEVVLTGQLPEAIMREMILEIRDEILAMPGISTTRLRGSRTPEISLEFRQQDLQRYGLSLADAARLVRESSVELSAGSLQAEGGSVRLFLDAQARSLEEFRALPFLQTEDGVSLKLGDVAQVRQTFAQDFLRSYFDGQPSAMLLIERVEGQNILEISQLVREYIEKKSETLPEGMELTAYHDRSNGIGDRINLLLSSGMVGGLLVLFLLALFLRFSVAFWVMLGIPIAMIGGLGMMPMMGTTVNLISMFAFILVLGIVVDDAIVTGESVYSRMRRGGDRKQAAIEGAKEVSVPVTFGVLTTMAAFLPLFFMPGVRGDYFKQLPLIIVPVLAFSLIESKLILPSHLSHMRVNRKASRWNPIDQVQRVVAKALRWHVRRIHGPMLGFFLRWRLAGLAFFVLIFVISLACFQGGWLRWVFFERPPSNMIRAQVELPSGVSEEMGEEAMKKLAAYAEELREEYVHEPSGTSLIRHVSWTLGAQRLIDNSNQGRVTIEVLGLENYPAEWRYEPQYQVEAIQQEWRKRVGDFPEALSVSFFSSWQQGSAALMVNLSGKEGKEIRLANERVREFLEGFAELSDVRTSEDSGPLEYQFVLNEFGESLGLDKNDLARQLRAANFGVEVQRFQQGSDRLRVYVRLREADRKSLTLLENLQISLSDGQQVPLKSVASRELRRAERVIRRENQQRQSSVLADLADQGVDLQAIKGEVRNEMPILLQDLPRVKWELGGDDKEQRDTFERLRIGVLVVMVLIYILLAIPLKSYFQPLIVMSIIPFSFSGAVFGHLLVDWLRGMSVGGGSAVLSIMSVFGMMALLGVVVNDSLVMVNAINQSRARGASLHYAVMRSGMQRFRPILLTTLTTFFGLLPLLADPSRTAKILSPMAISLGFGILLTTLVTLFFVPIIYLLLEDIGKGWHFVYGGRKGKADVSSTKGSS